jgi:putative nucleotidyltransferase with HDIG domain
VVFISAPSPFADLDVVQSNGTNRAESVDHSPAGIVSLLRNVLRDPDYAPPLLPAVALRLVEVSRDPDVDLAKVRALMESDPLIAAKVMSIAQSPFYSRGAPVESLDEALVRLGLKRLTGIFLEAAMRASVLHSEVFERPMEKVIKHSTATAHIARGVCRALQQPPERAFICALLHDIGIAGSLGVLGALPRRQRPNDFESISAAIEVVHEEATAIIGEKWALPWGVQWVIAHHHHYMVDGRVSPVAALVCMCDWLAAEAGAPALAEANQEQAERAMIYFGFDQPARKQLLDKCVKIVDELG